MVLTKSVLRAFAAPDRKALLVAEVAMATLCAYRWFDFWVSGFYAPDEYGYYQYALAGQVYGGRWFFGYFNGFLFDLFHIRSVDAFASLLPFYTFFWGTLTIILFYLIMKRLGFEPRTVAVGTLSSFVVVAFVLLSLGFLTESMGLTLAMGGVYAVVRYLNHKSDRDRLLWPAMAAVLFGVAGATREPYDAFLIAGVLLVFVPAVAMIRKARNRKDEGLSLLSILLFVVPAILFLFANSQTTSQLPALGKQFVGSIVTNPTIPPQASTTVTFISVGTQVITTTTQTTSGIVVIITTTTTTTSVATTVAPPPAYPVWAKYLLSNTLVIFIGGIFLGWGPLAFVIGLAGFAFLGRLARRSLTRLLVFLTALVALGSYLVVSYIFAPDPTYFSFANYSTMIRFSDTALPAFFLLAPYALARIRWTRRKMAAIAIVGVSLLLLLVPTYQVLAAPNLRYSSANPFAFGYHTDAVLVRDYINSHQSDGPFNIIGAPPGWFFTPGVEELHGVSLYSTDISNNPLVNNLTFSQFAANRWSTFYLDTYSDNGSISRLPTYLRQFVLGLHGQANASLPFALVDSETLVKGSSSLFIKVDLNWG